MLPAETRDRTRELSLVVLLLSYLVDPFVNAFFTTVYSFITESFDKSSSGLNCYFDSSVILNRAPVNQGNKGHCFPSHSCLKLHCILLCGSETGGAMCTLTSALTPDTSLASLTAVGTFHDSREDCVRD